MPLMRVEFKVSHKVFVLNVSFRDSGGDKIAVN